MLGSLDDVRRIAEERAERRGHKLRWRRTHGFIYKGSCKFCSLKLDAYSRAFDAPPAVAPSETESFIVRQDSRLAWTNVDFNYAHGSILEKYCERTRGTLK